MGGGAGCWRSRATGWWTCGGRTGSGRPGADYGARGSAEIRTEQGVSGAHPPAATAGNVTRKRLVAEAEAKVAALEAQLTEHQKGLAAMDPADWQAFSTRLDEQKALEADLAYAMSDWEAAQGALEELQR